MGDLGASEALIEEDRVLADSVVSCLQVLKESHVAVRGDRRRRLIKSIEVDTSEKWVFLQL